MKGVDIMMDFLFGWLVGKNIAEHKDTQPEINIEDYVYTPKRRKDMTVYEYWPAFDNDIPTLELAYKLYEENHTCHILKNGVSKCYYEFDGDDGFVETDPEHFFERI
jgi:hypothetical protein